MQKICKPNLLELTKFPVQIIMENVFFEKQEIGRSAACGKDF